ncbi:unnamed protein product, partial [marine sediment metagenome]
MEKEHLSKDVIFLLALELDLPSILQLCLTSKKYNQHICENPNFWKNKLLKEYPQLNSVINDIYDYKNTYKHVKRLVPTTIQPHFNNYIQFGFKN